MQIRAYMYTTPIANQKGITKTDSNLLQRVISSLATHIQGGDTLENKTERVLDKTGQDETGQDKTRQDKTSRHKQSR